MNQHIALSRDSSIQKINDTMETLMYTALICRRNEKFPFRVRYLEIFNELMTLGKTPEYNTMCEAIHGENIEIIRAFYKNYDFTSEELHFAEYYYWERVAAYVEDDIDHEFIFTPRRIEIVHHQTYEKFSKEQNFILPQWIRGIMD